ncbi:MAG: hypothetical protein ACK58L_22770 [Planctomycetota bacterium]
MSSSGNRPSLLMLEECYVAEDDRFLHELNQVRSSRVLKTYLEKLTSDSRPWARSMVFRYLQGDLSCPGHQTFFKQLFRHAESTRDHELMAAFMVSLDRLVRRRRSTVISRDRKQQQLVKERLFASSNATLLPGQPDRGRRKRVRKLFTQKTRAYLRRRVWRYFRWLSYRDPNACLIAMSQALVAYQDHDFVTGEGILDNWSLMHLCYYKSDVLRFTGSHCNLVPGKSLGNLLAAPYRPQNWETPEGFGVLSTVLASSRSLLVRIWAKEMLEHKHHDRLASISPETLRVWLLSGDPTIQKFGLEVFQRHVELPMLPIPEWLEFVRKVPPACIATVCRAMEKYVAPDRLSNEDILQLATAAATPVAELGLEFLKRRHAEQGLTPSELVQAARARCEVTGARLAAWALLQLDTLRSCSIDVVCEFFDSRNESCREAAMEWISDVSSSGYQDPALWARLTETPFDDVRLRLIRALQQRTVGIDRSTANLDAVWCRVLLGVHRGGREKLLAMDQIKRAIELNPGCWDSLMPVLAVAARSLRAPERRRALSVFASLMAAQPAVGPSIIQCLPELKVLDT